jgi:hypothetical protein
MAGPFRSRFPEGTGGLTARSYAVTGRSWIEANRAHALMFMGRDIEARALYLAYKGKLIPEQESKA